MQTIDELKNKTAQVLQTNVELQNKISQLEVGDLVVVKERGLSCWFHSPIFSCYAQTEALTKDESGALPEKELTDELKQINDELQKENSKLFQTNVELKNETSQLLQTNDQLKNETSRLEVGDSVA